MKEASSKRYRFWNLFIVDENVDGSISGGGKFESINGLFGDVNFCSNRDEKGIAIESTTGNLVVVRRSSDLRKNSIDERNVLEVRRDTKKPDGGVNILKSVAGEWLGGVEPFKNENIPPTNDPRLALKNVEHFAMAFKTGEEKIFAHLIDGKIVFTPGFSHVLPDG